MSTTQIALLTALLLGLFAAGGYLLSVVSPDTDGWGISCSSSPEHERNVGQSDALEAKCPESKMGNNPNSLQKPDNR